MSKVIDLKQDAIRAYPLESKTADDLLNQDLSSSFFGAEED